VDTVLDSNFTVAYCICKSQVSSDEHRHDFGETAPSGAFVLDQFVRGKTLAAV